ncbi:gliding motility-associated C-terminal domain-containing protein [Dyadobacter sp. CY345]|uniref:T9SS type B sorting domain-containing protein n=1 Tax=Dyadobacter sp. CY345 TaxID=2909335 RepID=UPI001F15779B|nr:gliding motility-associated C-terminal domain-containing protein [Dyadobacter sp. CY345]MCF2445378.1 gliding motility-associated C-terminal domain-containing protein [Dyadobacter sp. CY345]
MKSIFLKTIVILFLYINAHAQTVEHAYRFVNNLKVAEPTCAPDLIPTKAIGTCTTSNNPGGFVDDELSCGLQRRVYHNNQNFGLMYPNTDGIIGDDYTIQLYVKNTKWGGGRTRIIDFSNGQKDEGIYFTSNSGADRRCIEFDVTGSVGPCPYFKENTYYLLTLTRESATDIVTLYAEGILFASYKDVDKKYVGKAGIPISFYKDDGVVPCESGEANFAFLSVRNKYLKEAEVRQEFTDICFISSINQAADFLVDPNPLCGVGNVKVAYTGNLPSDTEYDFQWTFDGATVLSGSGRGPYLIHWNIVGKKFVGLTVTNSTCGNKIINIKNITTAVLPTISLEIIPEECKGQSVMTVLATNGAEPYVYSLDSVTFQSSAIFNLPAGNYRVFAKDDNGCVKDTSVVIKVNGNLSLKSIPDTTICVGQEIQLATTGDAISYAWSPEIGLDNPASKDPHASPAQTMDYIITAVRENCVLKDTVQIEVIQQIELEVSPNAMIPPNVAYQLKASSDQLVGISNGSYLWSPPAGLDNAAIPNPTATINSSQTYVVTVTTPQGCSGAGTVKLTIIPPTWINLPDVFTPNGDNENELLRPVFNNISSLNYLKIFNRWGEVIYFSKELSEGWDGSLKGIKLDNGSYVWKMEAVTDDGEVLNRSGTVLLIR